MCRKLSSSKYKLRRFGETDPTAIPVLSEHAIVRLKQRTSIQENELIYILSNGHCSTLPPEIVKRFRFKQASFEIFYSHKDLNFFAAVQNFKTREVLTILDSEWFDPPITKWKKIKVLKRSLISDEVRCNLIEILKNEK